MLGPTERLCVSDVAKGRKSLFVFCIGPNLYGVLVLKRKLRRKERRRRDRGC